jgi:hypothetical protein
MAIQSGYLLDGNDLASTYGVYIRKVDGILDFLKRKGDTAYNWLDEDGEEHFTDADDIHFEARDIVLSCYIKAAAKATFLTNLNSFKTVLKSSGLHTLKLPYFTSTFSVYFKAGGKLSMLTGWNSPVIVGQFLLTLREPNPS